MLAHILKAGVRALAISIILGVVLIPAIGGFDSPLARPLFGVIAIAFFIFWVVFVFLFGPLPTRERRGTQAEMEGGGMSSARGNRRDDDERGDGEAGDGDD